MIAHVFPPTKPLTGTIDPPSSKNFTTRYILASCLSFGRSIVNKPAVQDDSVAMVCCCRAMGAEIIALTSSGQEIEFTVENNNQVDRLEIYGFGINPSLRNPGKTLSPGNAGAVFRVLLAVSALLPEVSWDTEFQDSLAKRPNIDLIEALEQLGVEVEYTGEDGRLPIRLKGGRKKIKAYLAERRKELNLYDDEAVPITVSGDISSQYTSALLFLLPLLDENIQLHVTGRLKSLPLIETTRNVLSMAGVGVESSSERHIHLVRAGQGYASRTWDTNGDWPGTAAILAAAAVVPGSTIKVSRLFPDEQGERECVHFYERMGCQVSYEVEPGVGSVLVFHRPADETLKGTAINGDLCTDAVLAMMGAAFAAEGESRFVQIRNLQFKECDRVREPLVELRHIWQTVLEPLAGEKILAPEKAIWFEPDDDPDTIHLNGAPQGFEGGIEVNGRGDHRVIMLLSIAALRCQGGLKIVGAEHVSKSFPGWFDTLEKMGIRVEFQH
jgi:3-phosphoshikimate 1-carboxyvinyltransferase